MARRRNLSRGRSSASVPASGKNEPSIQGTAQPLAKLGLVGLGCVLVTASYYTADSTAVEQGDALLWCALCIAWSTLIWFLWSRNESHLPEAHEAKGTVHLTPTERHQRTASWLIDGWVWAIAVWVMVGSFLTSTTGSLRSSTNEGWLWITAAAVLTAARRIDSAVGHDTTRKPFPPVLQVALWVLIGISVGLSVHALHQNWVSLPADQAAYRADPDKVLAQLGLDAPAGSEMRMAFENRLLDGGPTATFALANSLAGVLCFGLTASLGICVSTFFSRQGESDADSQKPGKAGPWFSLAVTALIFVALSSTGSRSGMLAGICMATLTLAFFALRGRPGKDSVADDPQTSRWRERLPIVAFGGAAIGMAVLAVLTFGKKEWFEQAPASVAFRIQYWRTTTAMVWDSPWFGAGPGNFKVAYDRYREPSANEQIADPHNFFVETLAAGGFPAAVILCCLVPILGWYGLRWIQQQDSNPKQIGPPGHSQQSAKTRSAEDRESHQQHHSSSVSAIRSEWILGGGLFALAIIWCLGLLLPDSMDLQAQLFASPLAVLAVYLLWAPAHKASSDISIAQRDGDSKRDDDSVRRHASTVSTLRWIAAAGLAALLLHLCLSGGWSIPGVAIWIWVFVGLLTPVPSKLVRLGERPPESSVSSSHPGEQTNQDKQLGDRGADSTQPAPVSKSIRSRWQAGGFVLAGGLTLLVALQWLSIRPSGQRKSLLNQAYVRQSLGDERGALIRLDQAIQVDPWNSEAIMAKAEAIRWQLVQRPESGRAIEESSVANDPNWKSLNETFDLLDARSASDPNSLRQRIGILMHLFQRWGRETDLRTAADLLDRSTLLTPSHQWHHAQRAAVLAALGDQKEAMVAAKRASELATLGGNLQRFLDRQLLFIPETAGNAARTGPIRRPASEILKNLFAESNVDTSEL